MDNQDLQLNSPSATPNERNTGQSPVINADELNLKVQPISTPQVQGGSVTPSIDTFINPSQAEQDAAAQATAKSDKATQDLFNQMFNTDTQAEQRVTAEREGGLDNLRAIDKDIANEQFVTSEKFRREAQAIQTEAGLTSAQRNAKLNDVTRKQNFEMADIAVRKFVASNDLANASAAIDRKLEAQFAADAQRVEGLKFIANEYEGKEKEALQKIAKKEERAYQFAFDEQKSINDIAMQAAQAGAGQGEIQKIMSAQSRGEAIASAPTLGRAAKLDNAYKRAQIGKISFDMEQARAAASGAGFNPDDNFDIGTPENVVGWLAKSASSDKNIDQAQREQITQGLRAVSSVEALNEILFNGEDPLSTGRAKGRWVKAKSKIAEDITTKEFEALVIGLVPTAARGLFGEVGVLTDTDTERYKQLIGNAKNTQEENAAIQTILMDVASQSIGITLETAARSNQNVSGFTGRYMDVIDRVDQQKRLIGGVTGDTQGDSNAPFAVTSDGKINIPGITREEALSPEEIAGQILNKLNSF